MSDTNRGGQAQRSGYSRGEADGGRRQRAIEAYGGARERVSDVGRRAGDTITEAPLMALAGGFAIGAAIAALLPRTEVEERLIGPASEKLTERAREAARAAKDTGVNRLKELGLTPEGIADHASEAARASAQAALGTVRGDQQ